MILSKAADKLAVPPSQVQQLRLTHVRDGGREVDIWDGELIAICIQAWWHHSSESGVPRLRSSLYYAHTHQTEVRSVFGASYEEKHSIA